MNPTRCLFFDLESQGRPESELASIMPEFVASKVLKDPDKIAADIEGKKRDWLDSAALRATTGKIISAGSAWDDKEPEFATGDEATIINIVLHECLNCIALGGLIFTWNGNGFDLPFLCQRAAVHGIPAFSQLGKLYHGRYYWNDSFVDALNVWSSGERSGNSLDTVAKVLGVGAKNGSGKDFAALLQSDPVKAREYCLNDVKLLRAVVGRMGLNKRF